MPYKYGKCAHDFLGGFLSYFSFLYFSGFVIKQMSHMNRGPAGYEMIAVP